MLCLKFERAPTCRETEEGRQRRVENEKRTLMNKVVKPKQIQEATKQAGRGDVKSKKQEHGEHNEPRRRHRQTDKETYKQRTNDENTTELGLGTC